MSAKVETTRSPLVVAVVLTWNDTDMTFECVQSLLNSDYDRLHVILVDNGSRTPCGAIVKKRFPEIELITLPQNQGFTGGSNRGIERALELGANYIHLINNDATLSRQTVCALVRAMEDRPKVGAASPLLVSPNDRLVHFYTAWIDRNVAKHYRVEPREEVGAREWPIAQSDFVPFVAVMFRCRAFEEIGLFDESLSTCWEDFDLCIRLHDAAWQIVTVGDAVATHIESQTTGINSPYIIYLTTRNRLILLSRYANRFAMLRRSLYILRSFWWEVRGYGLANWACHRAFVAAWIDFLRGVRGAGWAAGARTS